MKTGFKLEITIRQAKDLNELLTKLQGAHDALRSLIKSGYSLTDLNIGSYGSGISTNVGTDTIYEPGDIKHSYGKVCYRVDELGVDQPISHVEYTARMLAKIAKAHIAEDPEIEETFTVLSRAEADLDLPSDIEKLVSLEQVTYNEEEAYRVISTETPETWIVTGKGVAVFESKGE